MGRRLNTVIDALPEERRQKIDARYRELVEEVESLKALRRDLGISQSKIAEAMNMSQPAVSKIENEADMLISTVRSYVQAMGGELDLVIRTPHRPPVRLVSFLDLLKDDPAAG